MFTSTIWQIPDCLMSTISMSTLWLSGTLNNHIWLIGLIGVNLQTTGLGWKLRCLALCRLSLKVWGENIRCSDRAKTLRGGWGIPNRFPCFVLLHFFYFSPLCVFKSNSKRTSWRRRGLVGSSRSPVRCCWPVASEAELATIGCLVTLIALLLTFLHCFFPLFKSKQTSRRRRGPVCGQKSS